jgi:putative hydrolase of the HAD superfamily
MSGIDGVIFDLGNVLLFFDWEIAANRLCARTGKSRQELDHYIMTTPFVDQLSRGELTKQRFFEIVAGDLGFTGTYEEFAVLWSDIFAPNEPMIALSRELKGKVRRIVLSNTNEIHTDFILKRYPFLREFEGLVLSHEVGLMKPDCRIYELALLRFKLTAARTVFVDDILANVEGARAAGLHGIHYQDPDQVRQELTKLRGKPI